MTTPSRKPSANSSTTSLSIKTAASRVVSSAALSSPPSASQLESPTSSSKPPLEATLVATSLAKKYGEAVAVNGLNLAVMPGEIYGLLGPNGSGKSTTLRMLTGILAPTSGTAEICGHNTQREPEKAKALLGYVPDEPILYDTLSALEFLEVDQSAVLLRDILASLAAQGPSPGELSRFTIPGSRQPQTPMPALPPYREAEMLSLQLIPRGRLKDLLSEPGTSPEATQAILKAAQGRGLSIHFIRIRQTRVSRYSSLGRSMAVFSPFQRAECPLSPH